jgi:hypothetical protein
VIDKKSNRSFPRCFQAIGNVPNCSGGPRYFAAVGVYVRGHFELVNQRSQLRGHLRQRLCGFHRFVRVGGRALCRLRHARDVLRDFV